MAEISMTTVSLSKLDLSFLKKPNPAICQPGRYRIDPNSGKAISAAQHERKYRKRPNKRGTVATPYFMPDVDAAYGGSWKSIVDGSEISSRTNWREHNKRNGVMQVDGDFWGKTSDDYVTEIQDRMGYDPSLTEKKDVFSWKNPKQSVKARENGKPAGKRSRRKSG
jgi:hypothetical protein